MPRRAIYAELTEDARAGWDQFATRRNITMTSLLEAFGLGLVDDQELVPERIVQAAKAIDRARRSRR